MNFIDVRHCGKARVEYLHPTISTHTSSTESLKPLESTGRVATFQNSAMV
jgi:hypothetical protein